MSELTRGELELVEDSGPTRPRPMVGNETASAADAGFPVAAVASLILLGLAIRVAAWRLTWSSPLFNDEVFYYFTPLRWIQGGPLDPTRPPAMSLLNAAVMKGFGVATDTVRGPGVVLGSTLVLFAYLIARQVGGRRSALIAAAVAALYPPLVGYSHYLYTETLFMVFALPALWLVLRQNRRLTTAEVALAGVACGMAALTRDVGVVLTLSLALSVACFGAAGLRKRLVSACLVISLAALVVSPWSLHIYRSSGRFGLVSLTTWMNLYLGNPAPGKRASMMQYEALGDSLDERDAAARGRALSAIRERMPLWPIEKLKVLLPLFQPTSFTVRRLMTGPERPRGGIGHWRYKISWAALDSTSGRWILALLTATSYVVVALFGFAGLILSRQRNCVAVLAIYIASLVVPVILTFPNTRFRLPIEPILIIGSAILLGEGKRLWTTSSPVRRVAAVGSVVAMACVLMSKHKAFLSATYF